MAYLYMVLDLQVLHSFASLAVDLIIPKKLPIYIKNDPLA